MSDYNNHREEVFFDPHASEQDKRHMLDGWFVPHLPDLNQRNTDVARYLIQYHIWATEEFGGDGWRVQRLAHGVARADDRSSRTATPVVCDGVRSSEDSGNHRPASQHRPHVH